MPGLDIGTSSLVSARELKTKTKYKLIRDAFYPIAPQSPFAAKMIEKGLKDKSYFKKDGKFILVGQDAIDKAVERNESALRPMVKGVVSPKEKEAFDVLKHIIKELLGNPEKKDEKVVYSIPAQPIDHNEDTFDVGYHTDVFNSFLTSLGYTPEPLNEAAAICYSELMEDELTGASTSWGGGQINICLMSVGEAVLNFSLAARGCGDYIDRMAAVATDLPDSTIQIEKEKGDFDVSISSANMDALESIPKALVVYYQRLASYFWANFKAYLEAKGSNIPKFKDPIPLVLSGGTSSVKGFRELIEQTKPADFPIEISEIRHAKDPLYVVARGCLLYSQVG